MRPEGHNLSPDFTVVVAPGFQADPLVDKVRSKAVIAINFKAGLILIGGTHYAGEIKKSIFTVLNCILATWRPADALFRQSQHEW